VAVVVVQEPQEQLHPVLVAVATAVLVHKVQSQVLPHIMQAAVVEVPVQQPLWVQVATEAVVQDQIQTTTPQQVLPTQVVAAAEPEMTVIQAALYQEQVDQVWSY
jgi:hypothetical protein